MGVLFVALARLGNAKRLAVIFQCVARADADAPTLSLAICGAVATAFQSASRLRRRVSSATGCARGCAPRASLRCAPACPPLRCRAVLWASIVTPQCHPCAFCKPLRGGLCPSAASVSHTRARRVAPCTPVRPPSRVPRARRFPRVRHLSTPSRSLCALSVRARACAHAPRRAHAATCRSARRDLSGVNGIHYITFLTLKPPRACTAFPSTGAGTKVRTRACYRRARARASRHAAPCRAAPVSVW
jgi:hypothetical protein